MEETVKTVSSAVVDTRAENPAKIIMRVETALSRGAGIRLVGLAGREAKEALLRVSTALIALGYNVPGKKMLISVLPSLPKEMTDVMHLDLPVAVSILAHVRGADVDGGLVFAGGLGLRGEVRETPATRALLNGFLAGEIPAGRRIVIPLPEELKGKELPEGVTAVERLDDVLKFLKQQQ